MRLGTRLYYSSLCIARSFRIHFSQIAKPILHDSPQPDSNKRNGIMKCSKIQPRSVSKDKNNKNLGVVYDARCRASQTRKVTPWSLVASPFRIVQRWVEAVASLLGFQFKVVCVQFRPFRQLRLIGFHVTRWRLDSRSRGVALLDGGVKEVLFDYEGRSKLLLNKEMRRFKYVFIEFQGCSAVCGERNIFAIKNIFYVEITILFKKNVEINFSWMWFFFRMTFVH